MDMRRQGVRSFLPVRMHQLCVAHDVCGQTVGNDAAFVQHDDAGADFKQQLQVVRGHQQRRGRLLQDGPGKSATKASLVRVRRLNKVDLPTFGRPTRAIVGFIMMLSSAVFQTA